MKKMMPLDVLPVTASLDCDCGTPNTNNGCENALAGGAWVDRMRRTLHSHEMVISSNAQITNNSTGFILPSFALADLQCYWTEVEIIQQVEMVSGNN